jgi:hypothetical protein
MDMTKLIVIQKGTPAPGIEAKMREDIILRIGFQYLYACHHAASFFRRFLHDMLQFLIRGPVHPDVPSHTTGIAAIRAQAFEFLDIGKRNRLVLGHGRMYPDSFREYARRL